MRIPGTLHDLDPRHKNVGQRNNAPRIVREVTGNFTVVVKVSSELAPGKRIPGANWASYTGAGLLLFSTPHHYLRLERNVWTGKDGKRISFTTPLYHEEGRRVNAARSTSSEFYKGRTTWLKIVRTGDTIVTAISHDGKTWTTTASIPGTLPQQLRVGVFAVNTSDKGFVAEFEGLKITQ